MRCTQRAGVQLRWFPKHDHIYVPYLDCQLCQSLSRRQTTWIALTVAGNIPGMSLSSSRVGIVSKTCTNSKMLNNRYPKYPSKENNSDHSNVAETAPAATSLKPAVASLATRQAAVMLAQQQQQLHQQRHQQHDIQRLSIASSASMQSSGTLLVQAVHQHYYSKMS